jgi:hypothetical protein
VANRLEIREDELILRHMQVEKIVTNEEEAEQEGVKHPPKVSFYVVSKNNVA